jgi:hypothetical protein
MLQVNEKLSIMQEKIDNSPFMRSGYNIDVALSQLKSNLASYCCDCVIGENKDNSNVNASNLSLISAPFQRDMTAWSEKMSSKFVENLILGAKTTIVLYGAGSKSSWAEGNCKILDGHHRVLSLLKFLDNKLPIFSGLFYDDIIKDNNLNRYLGSWKINLCFLILDFKSEQEACQYYIDINDGITHTSEDIHRANDYLLNGKF